MKRPQVPPTPASALDAGGVGLHRCRLRAQHKRPALNRTTRRAARNPSVASTVVTVPPTTIVPLSHLRALESGFTIVSGAEVPVRTSGHPHAQRATPSSTRGPPFVNCLQYLLGPPHRIRDCAHSRRNPLPAVELRQPPRSEDACRDQ